MRLIQITTLSIVAAVVMPVLADDATPDPLEKLETAIPEGIRLLEAKQYTTFVRSFVTPELLEKIMETKSVDEFAKSFGKRKAPRLLEVLEEIKDATPDFNDTRTEATFSLKEEISGKKSITFVRVEKHWYIKN